jgi:hypothetical protein
MSEGLTAYVDSRVGAAPRASDRLFSGLSSRATQREAEPVEVAG